MMKILPPAIEHVEIPEKFRPSQLVHADDCRLRVVFASSNQEPPHLPVHPSAERGKVFHALLEKAAKGSIPVSSGQPVLDELKRLLARADAALKANANTAHYSPLCDTMGYVQWHNAIRHVVAAGDRLLNTSARSGVHESGDVRPCSTRRVFKKDWPHHGRFAELAVDTSSIRLRGQLDLVEFMSRDQIVIHDYKTGQVRDNNGNVNPKIATQLRLYALALTAIRPSAEIRAMVSDGHEELSIATDPEELEQTSDWLHSLLESLPAGEVVSVAELASPGMACRYCQYRHVCAPYIKVAPLLWRQGSEHPLPNDAWGEVSKIEKLSEFLSIELRDNSGRRIKIHRISSRHGPLEEFTNSDELYFFGLGCSARCVTGGRFYGSRNFFELQAIDSVERAWSLAIFREGEGDRQSVLGSDGDKARR